MFSNVQLEKQYQKVHYYSTLDACVFIIPTTEQLPMFAAMFDRQDSPMLSCRGGPPLQTLSLRGPPLG